MTFVFRFTPENPWKQTKQRGGKLPLDDFSSLPSPFSIIGNFIARLGVPPCQNQKLIVKGDGKNYGGEC